MQPRIHRRTEPYPGAPSPGVPEATAQLLRLAESYEATQPSYAADLRAAASMAQRNGVLAD